MSTEIERSRTISHFMLLQEIDRHLKEGRRLLAEISRDLRPDYLDLPEGPDSRKYPKLDPRSTLGKLWAKHNGICHWCGRRCDDRAKSTHDLSPTKEHVVRLADGGAKGMSNLVLACRKCNNGRHRPGWKPEKIPEKTR